MSPSMILFLSVVCHLFCSCHSPFVEFGFRVSSDAQSNDQNPGSDEARITLYWPVDAETVDIYQCDVIPETPQQSYACSDTNWCVNPTPMPIIPMPIMFINKTNDNKLFFSSVFIVYAPDEESTWNNFAGSEVYNNGTAVCVSTGDQNMPCNPTIQIDLNLDSSTANVFNASQPLSCTPTTEPTTHSPTPDSRSTAPPIPAPSTFTAPPTPSPTLTAHPTSTTQAQTPQPSIRPIPAPTMEPTKEPTTEPTDSPTESSCTVIVNPTLRRLQSDNIDDTALDSSCLAVSLSLSVENILPDPDYVIPQVNIDAVADGLAATLNQSNITGFTIEPIDFSVDETRRLQMDPSGNEWVIDRDNCPIDNTVQRFYFGTFPHNISCIEDLVTDDMNGTARCDFETDDSIVFIWSVKSISTYITSHCNVVRWYVNIVDAGTVIGQSDVIQTDTNEAAQEFAFSETVLLYPNKTYSLVIHGDPVQCPNDFIMDVIVQPGIWTMVEPSTCELGSTLCDADGQCDAGQFALNSLCDYEEEMSVETRELFESVLYQNASNQYYIPPDSWNDLNPGRRRLERDNDCDETCTNTDSLHVLFSDGTNVEIANDTVFPCYAQCVCNDVASHRVYVVGGHINGEAIETLDIYEMTSQSKAIKLIRDQPLKLDRPRLATMCYYFRSGYDDNEYIMVISGMNNTQYINDSSAWFNDIVFIAIDPTNDREFPQIELKYNLLSMKPVITDTNMLYLFGGRNAQNASNEVQVIDLDLVFEASDRRQNRRDFVTWDRMKPMGLNRVLPFAELPTLQNEPCIMVFGGQDYINDEYVPIEIPVTGMQLYCNEILLANTKSRRRVQGTTDNNVEFTSFDQDNLQSVDEDDEILDESNIFLTQYNFTNNGILYDLQLPFKVCFDDNINLENAIDIIGDNDNTLLNENILEQSLIYYRAWSQGFGNVSVTNVTIIQGTLTEDPTTDPTDFPTQYPTENPSISPTKRPTKKPTEKPTKKPTKKKKKSSSSDSDDSGRKRRKKKQKSVQNEQSGAGDNLETSDGSHGVSVSITLILCVGIIGLILLCIGLYCVLRKKKRSPTHFVIENDEEIEEGNQEGVTEMVSTERAHML